MRSLNSSSLLCAASKASFNLFSSGVISILLSIILESRIIECRRIRQRRTIRAQFKVLALSFFFGIDQPKLSAIIAAAVILLAAGLRLPEIAILTHHFGSPLTSRSAANSAAASGISHISLHFRHMPKNPFWIVLAGFPHFGHSTRRRVLYAFRT